MEKAKYFMVWTEAPSASERPQTNWLWECVCACVRTRVRAHVCVFQRDILCFSSIIIPLNIYYWNVNSAENWGLCFGKTRPSPTTGVVTQWNIQVLFGETKGFGYINKSLHWIIKKWGEKRNKNLLTAGWTTPWLRVNWSSADLARSRSNIKMNWLQIVEIVQQAHLEYAALRIALFSDWFVFILNVKH